MPAQPAWFHRLPEILEHLHVLPDSYLDRLAVEKLFGVRQRRARQLMALLPGVRIGNAFAIERRALMEWLQRTVEGTPFQTETGRRARVAERLESIRRQTAGRRIEISPPPPAVTRFSQSLAVGIEIVPGELRIRFRTPEDLAAKLFHLSQAMAADWPGFQDAAGASQVS